MTTGTKRTEEVQWLHLNSRLLSGHERTIATQGVDLATARTRGFMNLIYAFGLDCAKRASASRNSFSMSLIRDQRLPGEASKPFMMVSAT